MNVSTHEPGLEALDGLAEVGSVCLFISEDERPLRGLSSYVDWRLCGAISKVLRQGFFSGSAADRLLLPSFGRLPMERVFAIGLGPSRTHDPDHLSNALHQAATVLNRAKVDAVALELPESLKAGDGGQAAQALQRFVGEFHGQRLAVIGDRALLKSVL